MYFGLMLILTENKEGLFEIESLPNLRRLLKKVNMRIKGAASFCRSKSKCNITKYPKKFLKMSRKSRTTNS